MERKIDCRESRLCNGNDGGDDEKGLDRHLKRNLG